jgi:hypothetical protein
MSLFNIKKRRPMPEVSAEEVTKFMVKAAEERRERIQRVMNGEPIYEDFEKVPTSWIAIGWLKKAIMELNKTLKELNKTLKEKK